MLVQVVTAVPIKTSGEQLITCTKILFVLQLVYFICTLYGYAVSENTGIVLFLVGGLYVPYCGYSGAVDNSSELKPSLTLFIWGQCCLSFFILFDMVTLLYNLDDITEGCKACFYFFAKYRSACRYRVQDRLLTLTHQTCSQFPTNFIVSCLLMAFISFTGYYAAFMAFKIQKDTTVYVQVVQTVPVLSTSEDDNDEEDEEDDNDEEAEEDEEDDDVPLIV